MVPECSALPAMFRLDRDFPRAEFEDRIVRDREEPWRVFGHCARCGQAWLVEAADVHSREPGLAIKIPNPRTWTASDERSARIDYLRQSRGGDASAGECIIAGCSRPPLKSIAYCAEHAFELTGARD